MSTLLSRLTIRIKLTGIERNDKYTDLARELKKTMAHEGDI